MSALAVYLEREGISTVVVALIREHAETIEPPRTLWVPFELGRPLGAYVDDGDFQRKVLLKALSLLNHETGPLLVDFTEEDPGANDDTSWQAPVVSSAVTLEEEIKLLAPYWQLAQKRLGRTMTGLSQLSIETAANYVERFDTASPATNPADDQSDNLRLRFSADDLKTYYIEACLATGTPSSEQIGQWLWTHTRLAGRFQHIRANNIDHEDSTKALICGRMLIPGKWLGVMT